MKYLFYILILILSLGEVSGQSTYRLIKQGNRELKNERFSEAEVFYRKALDQDANLNIAHYNIANAKYLQGDFDAAIAKYEKNVETFELKKEKAEAFHNMGNAYLSQEKYEESIEAYKNALKLEPQDMDTKYNLAYAQLKLKEQQEQEQEQQENQEENQEQDQENEDQEQDAENEQNEEDGEENESENGQDEESNEGEDEESDKEEQGDEQGDEEKDQDGEQGDEEQEQSGNAEDGQLSQEEAEQILKMLQSEEGKLQEKLDEPEGDPVNIIIEKDW